jgi:hypothetical protein
MEENKEMFNNFGEKEENEEKLYEKKKILLKFHLH